MDLSIFDTLKDAGEHIIVYGGALTAIGIGIRYTYRMVRNIDKLVETVDEMKDNQGKISERMENIGSALGTHAKMEEDRDIIRDQQLLHIMAEMSPNGGSSMKDVINSTKEQVNVINTRVAVLEQWKEDVIPLKRTPIRTKKKK
jgi:hypothetical protein